MVRFFISLTVFVTSLTLWAKNSSVTCPETFQVQIGGIEAAGLSEVISSHPNLLKSWSNLKQTSSSQATLKLFAVEQKPDLTATACMSHPGTCITCFYHDDRLPADSARIHQLHYLPAMDSVFNNTTYHDDEIFWMNTFIIAGDSAIPVGFIIKSFSQQGVVLNPVGPTAITQSDLLHVDCKPDEVFMCKQITEVLGVFQSAEVH